MCHFCLYFTVYAPLSGSSRHLSRQPPSLPASLFTVCPSRFTHLRQIFRNTPSTAGNSMSSSERPSPEPLLTNEAPPAVLGEREFWKCSESLKCFELQGLGHPSRTLEGNCRKRSESVSGVFPEFFRNFFRKVPAALGVWPRTPRIVAGKHRNCRNQESNPDWHVSLEGLLCLGRTSFGGHPYQFS